MTSIRKPCPFVGSGYRSASLNIDAQRCINFYLEADAAGKNPAALFGTPGTILKTTLSGNSTNRPNGMHITYNNRWFAIKGNKLYEILTDWSSVERGTILTSTGPVFMCDNGAADNIKGNQMLITDGFVYVYDFGTDTLTQITQFVDTDGTPTGPIVNLLSSTFQDGYGISAQPGTQNVFITNPYDFTKWEALDVGVAEGNPDNLVGVLSNGQDLWVFGTKSTEVWFDSGAGSSLDGSAFPFQRRLGSLTQIGCSAIGSIATLESTMYWLGGGDFGQGKIFRSKGYEPERISTHAIESYITTLVDVSNAFGFTQEYRGHLFYFITFPAAENGAGKTFCYDAVTEAWSERATLNVITGVNGRHLANSHVFYNNRHYVSDYRNGNIFLWDENTYTDNGDPLVSRRDSFHVAKNDDRISCREFQILMQGGFGTTTGQGFDPQAVLRVSKDYGYTYSHPVNAPMGKTGEYANRCIWRRLGQGRDFVFSVSISDPVPRVIVEALAIGSDGAF